MGIIPITATCEKAEPLLVNSPSSFRLALNAGAVGTKLCCNASHIIFITMLAFRQYSVDAVPTYTEYPSVNQQYIPHTLL